jgi:RNA polymerase sigma factor (TIGR02999 family)
VSALGGWLSGLPPKTVSELLANWQAGDDEGLRAVILLVYDELRRVAHHYLQKERPDHTLQSTALVHETYLRLEKQGAAHFENREHFVAICAQLMRQILVEYARSRNAAKRDAEAARVRALAAYMDFLTLWKDADPDIPILKEAKKEYAQLQ